MKIRIADHAGSFAEDKDAASRLRKEFIEPKVSAGESVVLDFGGVELATQSFVHALIAHVIREQGATVLERIPFKNCNAALKSLIRVVAEYSQEQMPGPQPVQRRAKRARSAKRSRAKK